MFTGFDEFVTDVGETRLFGRRGGSGPPLVLLHGFPETHLMWRDVAPVLSRHFTVLCPDLRGYGASGKPASSPDHAPYSKRALALDVVRLMALHGFDRFALAGHDRGGRVAYRLALEHPERVERLALLDVIPTGETFDRADARFALAFGPLDVWYGADGGPLEIWRTWAPSVTGRSIAGGHFFPEQNPDETNRELLRFFAPRATP